MPPRRAAAAKAAAATKPASKPAAKAKASAKPKAKTGAKRARDEVSDDDGEEDEPADDGAAADAPAPPKKAKKGIAPVDKFSAMDRTHKVYVDKNGEIYDATLNQTNIGKNNNKFYVLQLLYPLKSSATAVLFTRWGRVGENGATQTKGPWPAEVAVEQFKDQFKKKAGIKFEDRHTAAPKAGKYVHIEMQYDDDGEEDKADGDAKAKPRERTPDSALDKPVKDLVDFIFDPKYIQNHLGYFNYDANKLPLGKLSKETVANGYSVLKEIAEALDGKSDKDASAGSTGGRKPRSATAKSSSGKIFEELTNRYYSIIPHVFGRAKPTVINNQDLLKQEVDLVATLAELEETSDIVGGRVAKKEHPSDANLHSLDLEEIAVVDKKSDEFKSLNAYCHETYAYGNYGQKMTVEDMFRIERRGERQRWVEGGWDELPDVDGSSSRLLLFHGSRSSNFGGILKNGLKIAPPEAPHNGYLYGKGLYFAETTTDPEQTFVEDSVDASIPLTNIQMLKLSASYTYSSLSDDTGLVMLCEVAAKPYLHRIKDTQYAAEECKKAKKTLFKTEATDHAKWIDAGDATGNETIKGVLMPDVSDIQERAKSEPWWADNMFVAYDVSQVRIRYLVRMRFGQ